VLIKAYILIKSWLVDFAHVQLPKSKLKEKPEYIEENITIQ